jgi:hypothetical protein
MSTGEHVIGFALDVSGSMEASIQNVSGGKESRLDSIRRALDTLLAEAERLTAVRSGDQPEAELYFFAYAFGLRMPSEFGDLFRLLDCKDDLELLSSRGEHKIPIIYQDIVDRKAAELLASYEHRLKFDERGVAIEVMGSSAYSLLSMSRNEAELKLRRALEQHIRPQVATAVTAEVLKKDLTIPLSELTNRWMNLRDAVSMSNDVLGGQTPMAATLQEVAERFKRERLVHPSADCILFIISDGEATDADPRAPAKMIAEVGVKIVSCFVSNQNIVEPRRLYAKPDRVWPNGPQAMFDIASILPVPGPEADYLARIGWQTTAGAKMFAQINQSDLLSEFMNVVIAPIEAEYGAER